MAEQGREAHPNDLQSLSKRRRVEPQWEALGLEEMSSDEGEAWDSSDVASGCSVSPVSESGVLSSRSSTGAGDTRCDSLSSKSSEFSTDVSDTRSASAGSGEVRPNQGGDGTLGKLCRRLRCCIYGQLLDNLWQRLRRRICDICTEIDPGVIAEGDDHRRSMAKHCLCPSNTRRWFRQFLHG